MVWPIGHAYPVKTVTENASFKNPLRRFVLVWMDGNGGFFLKRSHHGVGYQYERIKRFRKRKKLSWILF